ncbi:MAG: alpha/beta hydrolase [Chlorobiaceae bacterium]
MVHNELPPTQKFALYKQELLELRASHDAAASKRAAYELLLMENSHFVTVNGIVHHYHDSGPQDAAETVLLIHGWDCWWMWWHHVINFLNKKGIRTIAYDMRGHGWSENDPDNHYHIDFFAHDLHELVSTIELKTFHIAAFSFGPFVALDYALSHSEKIRSMTFFNFGYLPNSAFIQEFANTVIILLFNNLLRKLTWWLPAYIFARLVLSKNTVMLHDILIGFKSLGFCAPEAIDQTTRQITSFETTDSLPGMVRRVDRPMLFVAGEGDTIMTCDNTKKLADLTSEGRYVCVPDCGHLITLELPDTTSALILGQVEAYKAGV